MNQIATRLASKPLAEGAFNDHEYSSVPIAQEAREDPDLFSVIPGEFTGGKRMLARTPVVTLVTTILAPLVKDCGKRLLVTQAYKSRNAKLEQWRELRALACVLRGYDPDRLTLEQEYEVGDAADAWGSYQDVDLCPPVIAAMEELKSDHEPELTALAAKHRKSVEEIALNMLSFRASNGDIDFQLRASGWSVFMSGGHLDLELCDLESGKPDFYGVPGDVLLKELAAREIFEHDDNREAVALTIDDAQVRAYLGQHGFERFNSAAFELARGNIRLLQALAVQCALIPWFGSSRTFSAPNFQGGKQAKSLLGHGDQAHAKKQRQEFAIWERIPMLWPEMVEGVDPHAGPIASW